MKKGLALFFALLALHPSAWGVNLTGLKSITAKELATGLSGKGLSWRIESKEKSYLSAGRLASTDGGRNGIVEGAISSENRNAYWAFTLPELQEAPKGTKISYSGRNESISVVRSYEGPTNPEIQSRYRVQAAESGAIRVQDSEISATDNMILEVYENAKGSIVRQQALKEDKVAVPGGIWGYQIVKALVRTGPVNWRLIPAEAGQLRAMKISPDGKSLDVVYVDASKSTQYTYKINSSPN